MKSQDEASTLTVLTSDQASTVSGGGALGGYAAAPLRVAVDVFKNPALWKQKFASAVALLKNNGVLSHEDRNIARDYANQAAFRNRGYNVETAANIRAGYGLESASAPASRMIQ